MGKIKFGCLFIISLLALIVAGIETCSSSNTGIPLFSQLSYFSCSSFFLCSFCSFSSFFFCSSSFLFCSVYFTSQLSYICFEMEYSVGVKPISLKINQPLSIPYIRMMSIINFQHNRNVW